MIISKRWKNSYIYPKKIICSSILLFIFISVGLSADDFQSKVEYIRTVVPKSGEQTKCWREKFTSSINFIAKTLRDLQQFNVRISAGYRGDRAGSKGLHKLNLGVSMGRFKYPNEFIFKANIDLQLKNSELQDNVTSMLINYEKYLFPILKVYGFVERFSNSYMGIQERWEIGGGAKIEGNFFLPKDKRKKIEEYESNLYTQDEFLKWVNKKDFYDKEEKKYIKDSLYRINSNWANLKTAIKKRYSRLNLGLAFSIFSELEQAQIVTPVKENEVVDGIIEEIESTQKFQLPAKQRLRFVVRPSIIFRPTSELSFYGHYYFKYPLGTVQDDYKYGYEGEETELDLRKELLLIAELKLSNVVNWAKNVSLSFEYHRHYDRRPPGLSTDLVNQFLLVSNPIAEDIHEMLIMGISVTF